MQFCPPFSTTIANKRLKKLCSPNSEPPPPAAGSKLPATALPTALPVARASVGGPDPAHKVNGRLQTKGKATKLQPAETVPRHSLSESSSQSADMDTLAAINFYLVEAQSARESSSAQSCKTLGVVSD